MKKTYQEKTIDDVVDFFRFVREECNHSITLFRGQRRDWPLVPKVVRLCYKHGYTTVKAERELINEFKRLSLPYIGSYLPKNDWEWISIAQHHGLATRLLDWSTNPLAALFFAVEPAAFHMRGGRAEPEPEREDPTPVVWVFAPAVNSIISFEEMDDESTPWNIRGTKVLKPPVVASRLNAQQGWFTVHKVSDSLVGDEVIPLERQKNYKGSLTKVRIADNVQGIRATLDQLGINRATLFPDLDGLASYLVWKNATADGEFTISSVASTTPEASSKS